jgi:pilus assembly protein CpaB
VRTSSIIMIALAALFGLLAVFVAQSWLKNQAEQRAKSLEAGRSPVSSQTIVVATKPLRFGNEITSANLQEVAWPGNALPDGAYSKITDVLSDGRRVVLTAIEPNEPVLKNKITGPGQRATLSATLRDGLKAVTIRVNDVEGVGGFVLPGDHVDVNLTRQIDKTNASNEVVLQSVRVLAIDQIADERAEKPAVVKAVTLEVDVAGAQKLALAASVGRLSLMLRKAGEIASGYARRITLSDLGMPSTPAALRKGVEGMVTIGVTRASMRQEYSVPIEGRNVVAAKDEVR